MKKQIFLLIIASIILSGCEKVHTSKIIFERQGNKTTGIYIMNSDGRNQTCILKIEKERVSLGFPLWSLNAKKIVFSFGEITGNESIISDIYIMDINTKNLIRITKDIIAGNPVWLHDGKKIVFVGRCKKQGEDNIYITDADGKNQKKIITSMSTILGLSLSPDSKKIVFDSNKNGNYDIYIVNIDGSNLVQLTNTPEDECTPAWSPNGKKIVFGSIKGLFVMNIEDKNRREIVDSSLLNNNGVLGPSFRPDGKKLIFCADGDIFIVDIDGKNLKNLTNTKNYVERFPSWGNLTSIGVRHRKQN